MVVDELLTPEEVAVRLKLDARTIQEWLRAGRLKGIKVGNRWRVRAADLEAFLAELPPADEDEPRPIPGHPLASLAGKYADDPLWKEFEAEIDAYRARIEAQSRRRG